MKLRILGALTALLMSTSVSSAAINVNDLAQEYLDQGYTRIEVKVGATQVKVEAIKDGMKLEVTYDIDSGLMVKTESEAVDAGDDTAPGVFIENERDDNEGTATGEDDNSGPGGDDDESDDEGDDSEGDDSGDDESDDDESDDSGDDDSGGDDDGEDDHSGPGGGDDD